MVAGKGCLIHTTTDFHDISPFPTTYQILIELESFQRSWARRAGALPSLQVPWDHLPVFLRKVSCLTLGVAKWESG